VLAKIVPTGDRFPLCLAFGYSTRALSHALFCAGFRVISVDAFGDSDTQDFAEQTHILSGWGDQEALSSLHANLHDCYRWIESSRRKSLPLPVFLAGGCENWLDSINYLARQTWLHILGPNPFQMKKLRSPHLWLKAALYSGLKFPETLFPPHLSCRMLAGQSSAPRWLRKSRFGSGGASVAPVEGAGPWPESFSRSHYLQKEVVGRVIGATCAIDWNGCHQRPCDPPSGLQPRRAFLEAVPKSSLIGVTESWGRHDLPGPKEFIYRGSWGPIHLQADQKLKIERTAEYLGRRAGVCGWLQMDLVEDADGQLWLLEVNPRWSAGMEILLKSGLANPVIPHAAAWELSAIFDRSKESVVGKSSTLMGKSIFYAPTKILLTQRLVAQLNALPSDLYADIPSPSAIGQALPSGAPLLTVLAETPMSDSETDCRGRLLQILSSRSQSILHLLSGD